MLGTAFWLNPSRGTSLEGRREADEMVALERDAYPSRPEDDPQLTASELQRSTDAQLKAAFDALNEKPDSDLVTGPQGRADWPRSHGNVAASGPPGRCA